MLVSEYVLQFSDSTELRLKSGSGSVGRSRTKPGQKKIWATSKCCFPPFLLPYFERSSKLPRNMRNGLHAIQVLET